MHFINHRGAAPSCLRPQPRSVGVLLKQTGPRGPASLLSIQHVFVSETSTPTLPRDGSVAKPRVRAGGGGPCRDLGGRSPSCPRRRSPSVSVSAWRLAGRGSTAEGPAPRWATWASGRLSWLDTGWGQKQTCRRAAPVLPQIPGHLSFLFPPGLRDQNPTPQLY